jgi:hypothetical protein
MKRILISAAILLFCAASQGQAVKHTSISEVFEGGPQSCLRFAEMAEKADAVFTLQEITEDEFRQAYKAPNKIVRNPGKVFDVGNVDYVDTGTSEHPSFTKFTKHEDKKHEFLHWYNAEGGQGEMFGAANTCFWDLREQESKDSHLQARCFGMMYEVMADLQVANSIAKDAADDMAQRGLELVGGYALEIERIKDRYNELVANVKAYNNAVNEYIDIANRIFATNRVSPPKVTLTPVRPQSITCTGDTLAFSQSTAYPGSTDTLLNATATIHCE